MQITFLGASHGVPEANRRCSCTLIETNGRYYFIDMGVNTIDALRTRGIEVEDVKGIFITHMHGDHTNGLISFVDLISWYFKTADPEICLPNLEGVEAIRAWLKANHCEMRDLRFKKVTDGTIFDDGYLKVTAIPTQHCPDSHAFFVEVEGKAVLFTGDLKHPNVDFPKSPRKSRPNLSSARPHTSRRPITRPFWPPVPQSRCSSTTTRRGISRTSCSLRKRSLRCPSNS